MEKRTKSEGEELFNHIPLVLISGAMCNAELWASQLKQFERSTVRSLVVNLSDGESVQDIAKNIIAQPYPQVNLVGFSAGGYIVQEVASIAPSKVNKFILIATPGEDVKHTSQEKRLKFIQVCELQGNDVALNQFVEKLVYTYSHTNPTLVDYVKKMVRKTDAKEFRRQLEMVYDFNQYPPVLASILQPALVVYAKDDPFVHSDEQASLAVKIKQSKLIAYEHGGHMLPLSKPDVINREIINFFNYTLPQKFV